MKLTALSTGYRNKHTTGVGFLLGAGLYLQHVGIALPQTGEQWGACGVALLAALLGLCAKEASRARRSPVRP